MPEEITVTHVNHDTCGAHVTNAIFITRFWKEMFDHMTASGEWTVNAACRTTDPDSLFVQGAAQNRAKVICSGCQVRTECLADALDNRVEFGVWGGMTERERRALLRRRPHVTSWRELLLSARDAYERTGTDTAASASRAS